MIYWKKLLGFVTILGLSMTMANAGITGDWYTQKGSHFHINLHKGKLSGKIVKLVNLPPTCTYCKGARHNQPFAGMTIFSGLTLKDGKWQGGTIFNPGDGKRYRVKIWQEGKVLKVRSYLSLLYQTLTLRRK